MDRLGPFGYLIEETSQEFFQDAAEGIAKEAKLTTVRQTLAATARKKPLRKSQLDQLRANTGAAGMESSPDVEKALIRASKGGFLSGPAKLAMLVYQSNSQDLVKSASESLYTNIRSYEDLMNKVAASAQWEPLGVTVSALDYLDSLEKIGIDAEVLDDLVNEMVCDSLKADAAIEATMYKVAGAKESFEVLQEQLEKLAIAGAMKLITKGLGKVKGGFQAAKGLAVRGGNKTTQAIGGKYRSTRDAIHRGAGIANIAKNQISRAKGKITDPITGVLNRSRANKLSQQQKGHKDISDKIESLKSQLANATPGTEIAFGKELARARDQATRQRAAIDKSLNKQMKSQRSANIKSRAQANSSTQEGARKAEQAAAGGAKTAPAATPAAATANKGTPAAAKDDFKMNPEWKAEQQSLLNRGSTYDKPRPGAGQPARPAPKSPASASSGTPKSTAKTPTKSTGFEEAAPAGAKPPVPKSAPAGTENLLAGKAKTDPSTYGEVYEKWKGGGWGALSEAEKRKVYVAGGAAFVGQRAVMDKPVI